ncbi:MAG: PEP-CTERM sorting domain-containing protein [Verrucomicrobiaceae bacterium]|nr:PEP-CTERM sorting domain-containing protein [Verrucomicrobiaceae bacterium]
MGTLKSPVSRKIDEKSTQHDLAFCSLSRIELTHSQLSKLFRNKKNHCQISCISAKTPPRQTIMSFRSFLYWLTASSLAALVVQSAEPVATGVTPEWSGAEAGQLLPVPEPGRALLLFAGIMAMAFTYRRAWMNWKSGPKV